MLSRRATGSARTATERREPAPALALVRVQPVGPAADASGRASCGWRRSPYALPLCPRRPRVPRRRSRARVRSRREARRCPSDTFLSCTTSVANSARRAQLTLLTHRLFLHLCSTFSRMGGLERALFFNFPIKIFKIFICRPANKFRVTTCLMPIITSSLKFTVPMFIAVLIPVLQ